MITMSYNDDLSNYCRRKAYLNNIPAGIDIAETWAPLRSHGVFAGIRYLFK